MEDDNGISSGFRDWYIDKMDPDSSTGGLNENSESGELDSLPGDAEYHFNSNSRDSLSKQSMNSERTNIDALDDTARDTIIVPPLDDSSSSTSLKRHPNSVLKGGEEQDHDLLDFGGDDDGEKEEGEEDDSDEGELPDDPSSDERSAGELSNHSAIDCERSTAGLEDGEVDDDCPPQATGKRMIKTSKIREKEEPVGDELEEGEVSDDEERRNKGPMPICRFFGKGQCTWGTNCRFLHPGVIDKGLYTMFDKVKPPPPPVQPMFLPKPGLLGHAPPNFLMPPALRMEPPIIETPWERAQREAKELIKQSEKIKETDIDFEDKKMNLTLTQEEFDKENDYYVKKLGTPEREPPPEDLEPEINEWDLPSRRPFPPKIDPNFVRERVHHLKPPGRGLRQAPPRDSIREAPPLHEPEVRMVRESNLRRPSRFHHPDSPPPVGRVPRRSDSYEEEAEPRRGGRDRGKPKDDWHDPWARPHEHKSGKRTSLSKRSRSYSSASSRSSSSSSQFSKSTKSSKSRSRSRSRSSKSSKGSPRQRKTKESVVRKAPPRRLSPKPMRIAPPLPSKDDFGDRRDGFGYGQGQQGFNRPPRYAPPPPPIRGGGGGGMKDRMNDKAPPNKFMKEREMRGSKRPLLESWTARSSSSRSRSRSRSFSKTPPVKRGPGPKRYKFSRERSRSKSVSPRKHRSWSRSSSSSSRSSVDKFGPAPALAKQRTFPDLDKDKERKPKMALDKNALVKPIKTEPKDEPRPRIKTEQSKAKVKMTLKPSSGIKMNKSILDKLADDVMGVDDDDNSNPRSGGGNSRTASGDEDQHQQAAPGRMKQSRREELLKQLQKVEEAIAKKRSKIS